MIQRDNILEELKELHSSLAEAEFQRNTFQVPEGYFDGLADEMLKRVKALESTTAAEELENLSSLLSRISKITPHSVPAGYFDELGKNLEQAAFYSGDQEAGLELEELSPLLSGLKNKPTYTTPEGYFANLPAAIIKKVSDQETKIVSLANRKWFRYAAAAVVIGFVAMIGFIFLGKKDIDPDNKSYAWVKKNLKKVSTDDISEFVELAAEETTDVAKLDTKDDEISVLLKDVSDKEIQDFLNDTQPAESTSGDDLILN